MAGFSKMASGALYREMLEDIKIIKILLIIFFVQYLGMNQSFIVEKKIVHDFL